VTLKLMGVFRQTRTRLVVIGCLVVTGYFIYTAATGAIRNNQLSDDRAEAARQEQLLADKKAYLEAIRTYVASDAYVEQQARRQLGYTRDGEVPFVVVSPALSQDAKSAGEWWERLFPR
jgi:cell division protein FtsB